MIPIIEKKRTEIPGGTWTSKACGHFEEGDPKKTEYFVKGFVEIRERGGQLKLFCKEISLEKRKKKKKLPPPPPPPTENEEKKEEVIKSFEELNRERVMAVVSQIEEHEEKQEVNVAKAPQFLLYLSKRKPKSRMPDIHKVGVRLNVKKAPNGSFASSASLGDFDIVLKDIPDVLAYAGCVVLKLPQEEPKTDEPLIIGFVRFESARMAKIHTMTSLGLNDLADIMIMATGGLDLSSKPKKHTSAKDKLKHLSHYRREADKGWATLNLEKDEELEFVDFRNMIKEADIIMLEPQAFRAFKAVEVQGDGKLGMSEYENFLMLYDIMGHTSSDLLIMDIFDYFKLKPDKNNEEFYHQDHEGLDFSAFIEGLHLLDVKFSEAEGGDLEMKNAFMKAANCKTAAIEQKFLTYEQFRQAWLDMCDSSNELKKRGLVPITGTFASGKNRDRLTRYQLNAEEAYQNNLKTINDTVNTLKSEHRKKTDEKKHALSVWREHLQHEAELFKSIRGQEKRLIIKKEQEEKTKKRIEEKLARNKLLAQQIANRTAHEAEISGKKQARAFKDRQEIIDKGWDKVDMSVQGIRIIEPEIYNNEDARIRFSYCELLDISRNIVDHLPNNNFLELFNALKSLKLSQNRLRSIPDELGKCLHLEVLELDSNRLRLIPQSICNLRKLQRIDFSNNLITELPMNLGLCADIKRFVGHSNQVKYLPESLANCVYMEYLDMSRNVIPELPEEFEYLTSLLHMDISSNRIGHLPKNLGKANKICYLDISFNQLASLPESFGDLVNLQFCSLEHNLELNVSTGCFKGCSILKDLLLSKNNIRILYQDFGACTSLMRLDIQSNRLLTLPLEFGLLTNLQELKLNRNELTNLPREIGSLMQLQRLELNNNAIQGTFPETIGLVTSLLYLDMSFNKIKSLPRSFIGLINLKVLNAERNLIDSLPDTLTFLEHLDILNLRNNKFKRFPIEMARMKHLSILDLANNEISLLPKNINLMTNLGCLNLSRNGLRALPVEFVNVLESVPDVKLAENPWTDLPAKWGKKFPGKHATTGTGGYIVADALDLLYGVRIIYDVAEKIWEETGAYHYSNRLKFTDFLDELRKRIPNSWDESLIERAKYLYFESKDKGIFPRWYSLDEHTKAEYRSLVSHDKVKRDASITASRIDSDARKLRTADAYDLGIIRRTKRKDDMLQEHAVNDQIKATMEILALKHCVRDRYAAAEMRHQEREIEFKRRDREEMRRLQELLGEDKHAREEDRALARVKSNIRDREVMLNPKKRNNA